MTDKYDEARCDLDNPATKDEVHSQYDEMTPGQKSAFNQAAKAFQDWQNNPQNAWFGETINPSVIVGQLRDAARRFGLDPAYLQLLTYNARKG